MHTHHRPIPYENDNSFFYVVKATYSSHTYFFLHNFQEMSLFDILYMYIYAYIYVFIKI